MPLSSRIINYFTPQRRCGQDPLRAPPLPRQPLNKIRETRHLSRSSREARSADAAPCPWEAFIAGVTVFPKAFQLEAFRRAAMISLWPVDFPRPRCKALHELIGVDAVRRTNLRLDSPHSPPRGRLQTYATTVAAFICLAMIRLMLRRLTRSTPLSINPNFLDRLMLRHPFDQRVRFISECERETNWFYMARE
jgi:hypothetical protein